MYDITHAYVWKVCLCMELLWNGMIQRWEPGGVVAVNEDIEKEYIKTWEKPPKINIKDIHIDI
jgi:hypothetical protein